MSPSTRRAAILLLLAFGAAWFARELVTGWDRVTSAPHAFDFASYYYAVHAAAGGLDPYSPEALAELARADRTRPSVFPFFYPPPFLALMAWVKPLSLATAYRVWFLLGPLWLVATGVALYRWRPGEPTLLAFALVLGSFTPLRDNAIMGQANLPVLALTVWGALLASRDRPALGGALVGLACMLKMTPALVVLWWLSRGRWRPAAAAVGAAVGASVLTLPVLGLQEQLVFYTRVLPAFGGGDWHGLEVPIQLFANHSLPNLWAQLWPGEAAALSATASAVGTGSSLVLVAGGLASLRRGRDDLAALGLLLVGMLVLPVYCYEHHLVFGIVPAVASLGAVASRRLGVRWLAALAPAWLLLAVRLEWWTDLAREQDGALRWAMQEAKFAALLVFAAACWTAARGGSADD